MRLPRFSTTLRCISITKTNRDTAQNRVSIVYYTTLQLSGRSYDWTSLVLRSGYKGKVDHC